MNEVYNLSRTLINYLEDDSAGIPVLVTFTTTLTKSLSSQTEILKMWKKLRLDITTKLKYRGVHFPIVAWAVESSKESLHVHCVFSDYMSTSLLKRAWKDTSHSFAGTVYINRFDTWQNIIFYIFKRFDKYSKFFGLSVILEKKHLYSV